MEIPPMNTVPYPRFEYWQTGTQWYWHLQGANGRIVGVNGGFNSEAGVKDAIATFCRLVSLAANRPAVRVYP
jgi:uncharacterized protein YegP (UPF0339 family)